MQSQPDNRMPPWRWWLFSLTLALTFGVICLVTRSWTPLRDGWPLIALIFALAVIRQGADLYEQRRERQPARRRTPGA